ncbi:MAG: M20/M25/M40 family metallo-hydrolase [Bryobacteraceae bacterium]|nr:M20/M25/M40 family metallo-hydrolase [Bryobacteraceae bacterium]
MKFFTLFLLASVSAYAEPDWPAIETRALDLLQRYIRIKSINPPADSREAAALFKAELEKAGLEPRLYASGPGGQTNLLVRLKGRDSSKKPLLLLNHFDVVPVDPQRWPVDPFGGVIKDGWIWGRGTLDMKGVGVAHLTALVTLKREGIVPARDIVMLSTPDEETGGERGVQWMLANHWSELNPEYVLDEGGMGARDVLAPGKLVFGIAVGEKQMLWLKLTATGAAGHGSQPIPDNANNILMDALRKALDQPATGKRNPVVAEMSATLGEFSANKFTAAIQRNTISLTTLRSGVGDPPKANVIPSIAEATLDCRLLPGANADEFVSELKARINDSRVKVERLSSPTDAGESSSRTPLFETIRRVIAQHHPGAVVTPMLAPYGTDSVHLRKRGIPAYGFIPMLLNLETISTMHSDAERIPVDQFHKAIRIFYDVLRSEY